MNNRLIVLFPVGALLLSFIAYFNPELFAGHKSAIIPLLALVMFSMGMTLTWQHFKDTLKQPLLILLAISIQFVFMPLFAYLLATALQLSEAHTIGLLPIGDINSLFIKPRKTRRARKVELFFFVTTCS